MTRKIPSLTYLSLSHTMDDTEVKHPFLHGYGRESAYGYGTVVGALQTAMCFGRMLSMPEQALAVLMPSMPDDLDKFIFYDTEHWQRLFSRVNGDGKPNLFLQKALRYAGTSGLGDAQCYFDLLDSTPWQSNVMQAYGKGLVSGVIAYGLAIERISPTAPDLVKAAGGFLFSLPGIPTDLDILTLASPFTLDLNRMQHELPEGWLYEARRI